MKPQPPKATLHYTLFPNTPLFRSPLIRTTHSPVGRTGEYRLQVGKPRSHADIGKSQLLASDRFRAGCKLKSEKPAKCKANCALAMNINILSLDFHVGPMEQQALDHGGDPGGRAALELGLDACSAWFDMQVDTENRKCVVEGKGVEVV